MILKRIVDVGTELFAIAAVCTYADYLLLKGGKEKSNAIELADLFCQQARERIEAGFREQQSNHDLKDITVARQLLAREYEWLESGIVK